MQLFSADCGRYNIKKKNIFVPQNIKKLPSKFAHNPTRPRVFSPASFCFVKLRQFFSPTFFSFLKLSIITR